MHQLFLSLTLLINLTIKVLCDDLPITTTKIYEITRSNPSDTIRIVEGEPLWKPTQNPGNLEERTFTNSNNKKNEYLDSSDEEPAKVLKEFLTTYSENLRKKQQDDEYKEEESTSTKLFLTKKPNDSSEEKSIKWDLLHYQKHHHPYDDKKGWVSMEPIPWSVSKISKWETNKKIPQHQEKPSSQSWDNNYESNDRYWDSSETYHKKKPFRPYESLSTNNYYNGNKDYDYYDNNHENKPTDHRPILQKPSSSFYNSQKYQVQKPNYYKKDELNNNCKDHQHSPYHHHHNHYHHQDQHHQYLNSHLGDILTDGQPPNFPQTQYENRRRGTEMHPDSHPFAGDGDWVLLSTTKGYKFPQQRQRSLHINSDSIGTHRSIRLTVLPPTKNSKVNMTTSHGGLLQVESTFETVEQAKNQFLKKLKLKQQQINKNKLSNNKNKNRLNNKQVINPATVTTTIKKGQENDPSAVLAAVGAGMIPATMAMLVPIAMNGKKRKRRDIRKFVTTNPYLGVELTLPRYI